MAKDDTQRTYDELLVLLVRSGDRRAGERLAARWTPRLLRTARRLCGDGAGAEEIVQDTWFRILRGLPGLADPARFPAWSFSILRRVSADWIARTARERARRSDVDPADSGISGGVGETRSALDQAFSRLSPDHRLAATLYFAEGLSLAEIAAAMRIPLGTAKSRIFHARRQLKATLEGDTS